MILSATLEQMAFLFSLIFIGYALMKANVLPDNASAVLSKLENYIFLPALVLDIFISNFSVSKLETSYKLMLFSFGLMLVMIGLAFLCTKFMKNEDVRKISFYGLCFSNLTFMGNAIVGALFPDVLLEYVVFTLVLWVAIYVWGVPNLLIGNDSGKGLKNRLKNLLNPMFICMIVGMIIGLLELPLPSFVSTVIDSASACMSPVAMLITGMTVAKISLLSVLKEKSVYYVSFMRLIVFPLVFIGVAYLLNLPSLMPQSFIICAVAALAMPLGLNSVVIPSAYGKDTTVAAGMALFSHLLSAATLPLIFWIMNLCLF